MKLNLDNFEMEIEFKEGSSLISINLIGKSPLETAMLFHDISEAVTNGREVKLRLSQGVFEGGGTLPPLWEP